MSAIPTCAPSADLVALGRLISQVKQVAAADVRLAPDTRFVADLGMKSLELVGLVFMCEQTFGVSLVSRPGLLVKLKTAGEAVEVIRLMQDGLWVDLTEPLDIAEGVQ